jgi:hypothetical protein
LIWVLALQPLLGSAAAFVTLAALAMTVALLGRLSGRRLRQAAAAVVLAAGVAACWLLRPPDTVTAATSRAAPTAPSAALPQVPADGGEPLERLRERIRAGILVDREAEYWEANEQ